MKERQILTNCLRASPTFSGVIFPPPPSLKCAGEDVEAISFE